MAKKIRQAVGAAICSGGALVVLSHLAMAYSG